MIVYNTVDKTIKADTPEELAIMIAKLNRKEAPITPVQLQTISSSKGTRHNKKWNDIELSVLVSLTEAGKSSKKIARKLGRRINAVYAKQSKLRNDGILQKTAAVHFA